MARLKYGSIVTEIRGKLGGHVFQKCGQLLSMRTQQSNRFSPSIYGLNSKNFFVQCAQKWSTLSVAEKASFSAYANTYPTTDTFGNAIVLTGYQLFIYINRSILNVSSTFITTAVAYYSMFSLLNAPGPCSVSAGSYALTFSSTDILERQYLFYMSDILGSDCQVHNPKTSYLTHCMPNVFPIVDIWPQMLLRYGNKLQAGKAFYLEVWLQQFLDGVIVRVGVYKIALVA